MLGCFGVGCWCMVMYGGLCWCVLVLGGVLGLCLVGGYWVLPGEVLASEAHLHTAGSYLGNIERKEIIYKESDIAIMSGDQRWIPPFIETEKTCQHNKTSLIVVGYEIFPLIFKPLDLLLQK